MKIYDISPRVSHDGTDSKIHQLERSESSKPSAAGKVDKRADQVNVSSVGRQVQKLLKIARDLPEVRTERVERLKAAFKSGQYKVDTDQLAKKIIRQGEEIGFVFRGAPRNPS